MVQGKSEPLVPCLSVHIPGQTHAVSFFPLMYIIKKVCVSGHATHMEKNMTVTSDREEFFCLSQQLDEDYTIGLLCVLF